VLHDAAYAGKPASVRHLLALGADPNARDPKYNSTPFGWCRHRHLELAMFGEHLTAGHQAVEAILEPITDET
jgi:ankyrin repeat protein